MSDLTLVYLGYCIIRGGKICVNIAMSAYYIQHFYCQNLDFKDSFSSYHYIIDASFHSSEKTGLRSTFWPRETLQNLLCLWKKKTQVVFFVFHLEQLWVLPLWMPWSMSTYTRAFIKVKLKVAWNEKWKKPVGFSFSINIANFEAFLDVKKLSANLFFLKSAHYII